MRAVKLLAVVLIASWSGRPQPVFRIPVRIVEVPATIASGDGKMLRGINADELSLFDNDLPQRFRLEEAGQAFSVAIAIQTNAAVRAWLPEVSRSAGATEALLLGSQGEGAVIGFADEVTVIQALTPDAPHLDKAFHSLVTSGDKNRCLDAVRKATEILGQTAPGSRRILLLIAQPGDYGSKALLRDVIGDVERNNITVYCLAMPRIGKDLLSNIRVSGLSSPGGRDTGFIISADLTKLIPEIYRGSKSAAGEDAVTLLATYTGGTTIPFRKRADLDTAISLIGEELHTGYVLTYTPSDVSEGYHQIRVAVNREGATVRARPGYYATNP